MPGYMSSARIRIGAFSVDFVDLQPYSWQQSNYYAPTSDTYSLDVAVDRIERVYTNQDTNALDSLVPSGYDVNVQTDGGDSYSMSSNDFHDMMLDNMSTTQTQQFQIVQVQRFRAGARVRAVHTFTDPSGRTVQLQQVYILSQNENGYSITSLRISPSITAF